MEIRALHLVINGRFRDQPVTGVQRYAREATAAMRKLASPDMLTEVPFHPPHGWRRIPGSGHLWEQAILPGRARRVGADVILSLTNWSPLTSDPRCVVVVHDDLSAAFPSFYTAGYRRARRLYMDLLRRSRVRVVTVSERSQSRLQSRLGRRVGLAPGGVRVPAEASDPGFAGPVLASMGLIERSYVLLVGAHDPRKNADFARALVPELRRRGLQLVMTSRVGSASLSHAPAGGRDDGRVRLLEDVSDVQLWALYSGALALLHPSLAEGFGLPMLEASAVGTPFLTTDVGMAAELAVDDAQLLPLTIPDWSRGLDWVARERGFLGVALAQRARRFTWEVCAEKLLEICRSHQAEPARTALSRLG